MRQMCVCVCVCVFVCVSVIPIPLYVYEDTHPCYLIRYAYYLICHTPLTQEHGMSGGVAGVLLTGSALKGSVMAKGAALQEKLQSKSRSTNAFLIN